MTRLDLRSFHLIKSAVPFLCTCPAAHFLEPRQFCTCPAAYRSLPAVDTSPQYLPGTQPANQWAAILLRNQPITNRDRIEPKIRGGPRISRVQQVFLLVYPYKNESSQVNLGILQFYLYYWYLFSSFYRFYFKLNRLSSSVNKSLWLLSLRSARSFCASCSLARSIPTASPTGPLQCPGPQRSFGWNAGGRPVPIIARPASDITPPWLLQRSVPQHWPLTILPQLWHW